MRTIIVEPYNPAYVFDGYHPAKVKDELGLLNWTERVYTSVEKWGLTIK